MIALKPTEARLCSQSSVIKNELHFVFQCTINKDAVEFMYNDIK